MLVPYSPECHSSAAPETPAAPPDVLTGDGKSCRPVYEGTPDP